MVSSPVTDLLNESNSTDSSFEESLENAEGKTLEIHRFIDDGVKMVSVNGFCISLTSLLEMVGVEERVREDERVSEDESCYMAIFVLLIVSMVSSATCFFFAFMEAYCPKSL